MSVLKEHPLIESDLREAFEWYEDELPGLGTRFLFTVRSLMVELPEIAWHHRVRFADIRRVNVRPFSYGIFYIATLNEIRALAVLHAARRHRHLLDARRRSF